MVTDINLAYCGEHFAIDTNIESLCCTPENNTIRELQLNF